MKETFYFSHDYNARNDDKIKKLLRKHWMEGYWVYWAVIEELYNNANALNFDCEGIAYDLRSSENIVKSVLTDFELFVQKWSEFYSKSVWDRLLKRDEKSRKARESAEKRWGVKNANAYKKWCEGNAIKERKGKENKIKKEFFSKISNQDTINKIDTELWYYLLKFPNKQITKILLENIMESFI